MRQSRSNTLTSIVTESPTRSSPVPLSPKSGRHGGSGDSVGSLALLSPVISPAVIHPKFDEKALPKPSDSGSSAQAEEDPHAYRKPEVSYSRSPCPALNTLANHGYLPRDGKDITIQQLLDAFQRPDTYNLSSELANLLARGGEAAAETSIHSMIRLFLNNPDVVSLFELGRHGRVEHDSSQTHKNTPPGKKFGPIRTDTQLLNDFLGDESTINLAHIARRRVALERVSPLDTLHAEIARGEWALVLGVFGHAYGGKVPVDLLRAWLYDNRFPDKWQPSHQQTLFETVKTARDIRKAMEDIRKDESKERTAEDDRIERLLTCQPVESEALE